MAVPMILKRLLLVSVVAEFLIPILIMMELQIAMMTVPMIRRTTVRVILV
jgi:hypothetical protein